MLCCDNDETTTFSDNKLLGVCVVRLGCCVNTRLITSMNFCTLQWRFKCFKFYGGRNGLNACKLSIMLSVQILFINKICHSDPDVIRLADLQISAYRSGYGLLFPVFPVFCSSFPRRRFLLYHIFPMLTMPESSVCFCWFSKVLSASA